MADQDLRELERRWKASGADDDRHRLLNAIERYYSVCVHREIKVETIRGEIPFALKLEELAARLECKGCAGCWEVAFEYPRLGSYALVPGATWDPTDGVSVTLEVVEVKNNQRTTYWTGSWINSGSTSKRDRA